METKLAILMLALIGPALAGRAGNMQITGRVIDYGLPFPPDIHIGDVLNINIAFTPNHCQNFSCGLINSVFVRINRESWHDRRGLVSYREDCQEGSIFYAMGDSALLSVLYDELTPKCFRGAPINNKILVTDGKYVIFGELTELPKVSAQ